MNLAAIPLRTRSGAVIYVPPDLRVITTYVLLEQESWFEAEVDFIRSSMMPGEVTIDIGANFGLYSVAMAQAVGSTGQVHAFEPTLSTCAFLQATLKANQLAHAVAIPAAVSDRNGQARLKKAAAPELNALTSDAKAGDPSIETVNTITLDHYLSKSAKPISLIKVDAEGHELNIGAGAAATIKDHQPLILFEIKHGAQFNFSFLDRLREWGFAPFRLVPGLNLLAPFDPAVEIDAMQLNLFACTPTRATALNRRGLVALQQKTPGPEKPREDPTVSVFFAELGYRSRDQSEVLAHYSAAQNTSLSAEERHIHLIAAYRGASAGAARYSTPSRHVTLSRIANDLGLRTQSVSILKDLTGRIVNKLPMKFDEACLSPTARLQPHTSNPDEAALQLRTAILESYERQRAFSSLFTRGSSGPFLHYLCQQPFCSPEMFRRRQLVDVVCGRLSTPGGVPELAIDGPDNLNAAFWRDGIQRPNI